MASGALSPKACPVRVFLRVRPADATEAVSDLACTPGTATMRGRTFPFDTCFANDAGCGGSQDDVYRRVGPSLLDAARSGMNATVLAYGQSGSGKTHTMFSGADGASPGIVPRLLNDLFARIADEANSSTGDHGAAVVVYCVTARMFEVYNERAYDMISASGRAQRKDAASEVRIRDGGVIEGINEPIVTSADAAAAVLSEGQKHRASGATNRNDRSSRSHAVFQLRVRREETTVVPTVATSAANDDDDDGSGAASKPTQAARSSTLTSLISLVDLAGSERYADAATGQAAEATRLREMVKINLSLSTLRRVIEALAKGGGALPPYRDSLVTRALSAAFGGNSQTAVVATVSPCIAHADDTFNTLQFAAVARRVVNKTSANANASNKMLDAMSAEIAALKLQLAEREAELAARALVASVGGPSSSPERTLCDRPGVADVAAQCDDDSRSEMDTLGQQLSHVTTLYEAALGDASEHAATTRQLALDVRAKDEQMSLLRRQIEALRRSHARGLDALLTERCDMARIVAAIREPLQREPGCPQCQAALVEVSTTAKQSARLEVALADAEDALAEARLEGVRLKRQSEALVRDLVHMQNKLNASATLQVRCDEQAALLDARETQIEKYLGEMQRLALENLQLKRDLDDARQAGVPRDTASVNDAG